MSASDDLSVTDQAKKEVETPGGLPRTIPTAQEPRLQAASPGTLVERLAAIRRITGRELFAAPSGDSVESEDQESDLRADNQNDSNMSSNADPNDESATANPNTAALPTVFATAADMFKIADPVPVEKLTSGTCEFPRALRGADSKTRSKTKERCCKAIDNKFDVPFYYRSSKYTSREEDDGKIQSAHDAIISVKHRCDELKLRIKSYDLQNACLVPLLINEKGLTPVERWDFSERRHLLDHYGSISQKEIKIWCDDCLRWGKDGKAEQEDQDWLLTLARNSSTTDLQVSVDRHFDELEGKYQGGVVYIWLMLDAIVKITDDVASGLQKKIKDFGRTGLFGYVGENVEVARIELLAICSPLAEKNLLQSDSVNDVIEGLSKCSHKVFAKIFSDLATARRNTLMTSVNLNGTTLEQIRTILDEADKHYSSFTLSSEWNASPSANSFGVTCDNCGGSHVVRDCTEPKDQDRIARNAKARNEKFREYRANNNNSNSNRGGDRNYGGNRNNNGQQQGKSNNYGRKQWGKPKDNEIVRKIQGKAYAACKQCGWNKGPSAHTTGRHDDYERNPNGFETPSVLKAEMKRVQQGRTRQKNRSNDDGGTNTKKKDAGVSGLSAMVDACSAFEKDTANPEASAFAGHMRALLLSMGKD